MRRRHRAAVPGHDYADPLCGVEENLAYNAFLVGRTLLGMRVADVLAYERGGTQPVGDIGTRTGDGEPAPADPLNRMSR